jgi:hypothetical protein
MRTNYDLENVWAKSIIEPTHLTSAASHLPLSLARRGDKRGAVRIAENIIFL